jgi:hypothetical protein
VPLGGCLQHQALACFTVHARRMLAARTGARPHQRSLLASEPHHSPALPAGEAAALAALQGDKGFLSDARLGLYASKRNDPCVPQALSGLSPYLHYGQLSAQRAALEAAKLRSKHKEAVESFLEELVVRRWVASVCVGGSGGEGGYVGGCSVLHCLPSCCAACLLLLHGWWMATLDDWLGGCAACWLLVASHMLPE